MTRATGYPIVFNVDSVDLGGFVEVVRPQAFDRMVSEDLDVVALRNHDSSMPLGRESAKTLDLTADARGVALQLDLDESVSYVGDLVRIIGRGDATGGSFAFETVDDQWSLRNGTPYRELLDMRVREVSLGVSFPAYAATRLSVRAGRSVSMAQRMLRQRLAEHEILGTQMRINALVNSPTRPATNDVGILRAWSNRRAWGI